MSRLVARILLAIFMLPVGVILYSTLAYIGNELFRGSASYSTKEMAMFLFAGLVTWIVLGLFWFLLWRKSIFWSKTRTTRTILVTLASLIIPTIGVMISSDSTYNESIWVFMSTVIHILGWLIATVFLWRETAAERAERVRSLKPTALVCPTCGYNLTGLNSTRCPECGNQFALDELLALQPANAPDDIGA